MSDDIWSQPPSPSVDAAWQRLNHKNMAWATAEDLVAAGKNLSTSVKFPAESGFGDDAYPILVDLKHKTHCLNRIRKDLYFDHYWKDTFPDGKPSDLHKDHTNHCVSILLQSLLCEASTDFVSYSWYQDFAQPFPSFNFQRQCGDYQGVADWIDEREVQQHEIVHIQKPDGQPEIAMTTEALRVLRLHDG